MSNIESYRKRFYSLMESQMGDVKPLTEYTRERNPNFPLFNPKNEPREYRIKNEQINSSCLTAENRKKWYGTRFNTETGMAKVQGYDENEYKFECDEDGQIIVNGKKMADDAQGWAEIMRYYGNLSDYDPDSEWMYDGAFTYVDIDSEFAFKYMALKTTNPDKHGSNCYLKIYNDGDCYKWNCDGASRIKGTWSMNGNEPVLTFDSSITRSASGLVSDQDTDINTAINDENKIMKIGSKGPLVKKVQNWLLNNGYDNYNITNDIEGCKSDESKCDGIYGKQTKAAVMQYQTAADIQVDGIVGGQTIDAMGF